MFWCLVFQVLAEQQVVSELEGTLSKRAAEYDQFEAQIQSEHDEEVSALHQQKDQLSRQLNRQLEELKQRYVKQENQVPYYHACTCIHICACWYKSFSKMAKN